MTKEITYRPLSDKDGHAKRRVQEGQEARERKEGREILGL